MKAHAVGPVSIWVVILLGGCSSRAEMPAPTPAASTRPSAVPTPNADGIPNWTADATVVSVTNPGHSCGWGTTPGDTRSGVGWQIKTTGDSVVLDEDMRNWPTDDVPFTGTLTGRQFSATYSSGDNYLNYACQFKGGSLTGTFSEDSSTFDATETLVWGPPGAETTVQRHWKGSKL